MEQNYYYQIQLKLSTSIQLFYFSKRTMNGAQVEMNQKQDFFYLIQFLENSQSNFYHQESNRKNNLQI
ncbi:hypothetical protein pb186bvf_002242 [Paramecium bursaria]